MSRPSLLVAERTAEAAQALGETLEQRDYDVIACVDSARAVLDSLQRQRPHLVLLAADLDGEIDPIQAALHIRDGYFMPVLFIADEPDQVTLEGMRRSGANGCIRRPIRPADLCASIEIARARHQDERQLWQRLAGLDDILSTIGDAVVATNAQGHVTYMNPAARERATTDAHTPDSTAVEDVFAVANADPHPVRRVLDEGVAQSPNMPVALVREAGDPTLISTSTLAPIRRSDGQVAGVVWVFGDTAAPVPAPEDTAAERLHQLEALLKDLGLGDRLDTILTQRKKAAAS